MPPPKKAAKKSPGHPDPKKPAKDMRRAYEHLGRTQSLVQLVAADDRVALETLVNASERALTSGFPKDAADLLRASEHLAFGSVRRAEEPDTSLSRELRESIQDEFDHLLEKADEHGGAADAPKEIASIYGDLKSAAKRNFKLKRYRAALEFIRAAEALTHLKDMHQLSLASGGERRKLGA